MSLVVSDTTPLNYLILIGQVDVLPALFGEVAVPPAVLIEMQHAKAPALVAKWAESPPAWLRIQAPAHRLELALGPGETEAISLALELGAQAILVDDGRAKREAQRRGFSTIGTAIILELAQEAELLDLETCVGLLKKTTFRIETDMLDAMLARARSRKKKGPTPPDR